MIKVKKRIMLPSVACISSGIIDFSLVNFYEAYLWQIFTKWAIILMKITHEVQFSPEDNFTNSRTALAKLLNNKGHTVSDLRQDLILSNYQIMPLFPDYITSLSHTKGAGAAILAQKADYQSIGVDIEWCDRVFKPEIQIFFKNDNDRTTKDLLELWTKKEAAFKALSPLGFPGVLVLSKIIIQDDQFWTAEQPHIRGALKTLRLPILDRELYFSIAGIEHF